MYSTFQFLIVFIVVVIELWNFVCNKKFDNSSWFDQFYEIITQP
jgi:hypothetical protein